MTKENNKKNSESEVLANIAAMPKPDRSLAERIHSIIKTNAPALTPKLWYGMPAYAKNNQIVCFFQSAHKFKTRYATFGFQHEAKLDNGHMWPVAYALIGLSDKEEKQIAELIKKAAN